MSEKPSLDELLNSDEPATADPVDAGPNDDPSAANGEATGGKVDDGAPAPTDPAATQGDPPPDGGQPRGPDGKFIPKGDTPPPADPVAPSAPPASQEDSGNIPIAALKDERSKRQALEAELTQLRQTVQQMQAPQQPEQAPDRWEDPEGYDRWLMGQVTAAAEQKAIEAFNYQRIATAAAQFRADKPDYDETIQAFGQMAQFNPGLIAQMQQAANPAEFAYSTAKQAVAINQAGSLDAYVKQEAERIAAERAAEQQQQLADVQQKLPSAPPTISGDRSVGSRSGPAWPGPAPLSDLLT